MCVCKAYRYIHSKINGLIMENLDTHSLLPGVPLIESPLFYSLLDSQDFTPEERDIAIQLHTKGYAVIDFPDRFLNLRAEQIKHDLAHQFDLAQWQKTGWKTNNSLRIQDAWQYHADVKSIATNPHIIALLSRLYGKPAFAFQTLNFPVGTQQHVHTDSIHFSSVPERYMCGVWVALEDIHPDAGPLIYYPSSHKWPIIYNEMLEKRIGRTTYSLAQEPYEPVWRAMINALGAESEIFCAKKGQALIWAANLLHGGSKQINPTLTRWSQVTHYYFDNCTYYTPAFSDNFLGNLYLREPYDIAKGHKRESIYINEKTTTLLKDTQSEYPTTFPNDFDAARYYQLNPDVSSSGIDAEYHYKNFGMQERRQYK